MAHTNHMPHVTQTKLEQLIRQNTRRVGKAKQTMIGKHRRQAHGARVQQALVTQVAQTGVAVHDLDVLADEDVAQDGEGGDDGGEGGGAVDDPVRQVVDFEAPGEEVADPRAGGRGRVGVGDDGEAVAAGDEFLWDWSGVWWWEFGG